MKQAVLLVVILLVGVTAAAVGSQGSLGASSASPPSHDSTAERYKRFARDQTRALAVRTCREIPRRELFRAFSTSNDPDDDNFIALGYAAQVRISPIPLQRDAYEGCMRGLRGQ